MSKLNGRQKQERRERRKALARLGQATVPLHPGRCRFCKATTVTCRDLSSLPDHPDLDLVILHGPGLCVPGCGHVT
jgi:hypothetical protein